MRITRRCAPRLRRCLVRIAFYGLFLLGPALLSQGHAFYVLANQHEAGLVHAQNGTQNPERHGNPYRTYQVLCDRLGFACIGVWFAWLVCAVVIEMAHIVRGGGQGSRRK